MPGIIGFKAFHKGLKARGGFQYEIGKEYEIEGKLEICKNGFHFCRKKLDVDNFYDPTEDCEYALIEALGEVVDEDIKSATSKIKIIKMLTRFELETYIKYHSVFDEPSYIDEDGNMYWYKFDKIHRDNDLPAIVMKNGIKHWFQDGVHKRNNGKPITVGYQGQQYFMGDTIPMPRLHYIEH
jgi:hypothetical protein